MEIIEQKWQFENKPDNIYDLIEGAGRTCWKSEDKKSEWSAEDFIRRITKKGHTSVLEHGNVSVRIITDRGVTHELVRHRIGVAYSQESTRYCNYSKEKFNNQIQVIRPVWYSREDIKHVKEGKGHNTKCKMWYEACKMSEAKYVDMMYIGANPQEARAVLPNSLKTEIVMTANMREWYHIFNLRCAKGAHPQIRNIMLDILFHFTNEWPAIFEDLAEKYVQYID